MNARSAADTALGDGTWCEVDGCGEQGTGRVCGSCVVRYETALRAVPGLEVELELTRTRQDRTNTNGPVVSRSPTRPLPFKEHPREAAADLWDALAYWYGLLVPEAPDAPCDCYRMRWEGASGPACWADETWRWETAQVMADWLRQPASLADLATWLLAHTDESLRHDDAAASVSTILVAVRNAERAIDGPAPLITAGACEHCGRSLYGRLGRKLIICDPTREVDPGCGAVYSAEARREHLLEALRAHTATAAEIAHGVSELVGVRVDRRKLNVWATRIVDTALSPDEQVAAELVEADDDSPPPRRARDARPKLADRRTVEEFRAGQADPGSGRGLERVFLIGEVLDLITARATERQVTNDRRRSGQPAPVHDDWARRMADGEGFEQVRGWPVLAGCDTDRTTSY